MPVVGSPDLAVNNASNDTIPSPAAWCSHTTLSSHVPCCPLFWLPPRGLPTGLPTVSPDESGTWASPPFARAVLPLPAPSPFFLAPDSCLCPRSVLDALRLPPPIQNNNNDACGSLLLSVFRFRVGLHSLPTPPPHLKVRWPWDLLRAVKVTGSTVSLPGAGRASWGSMHFLPALAPDGRRCLSRSLRPSSGQSPATNPSGTRSWGLEVLRCRVYSRCSRLLWRCDIAVIDMGLAASRRKRLPRENRINLCCQLCTRSCLVPDLSAGLRNRMWIYVWRRQKKKKKKKACLRSCWKWKYR